LASTGHDIDQPAGSDLDAAAAPASDNDDSDGYGDVPPEIVALLPAYSSDDWPSSPSSPPCEDAFANQRDEWQDNVPQIDGDDSDSDASTLDAFYAPVVISPLEECESSHDEDGNDCDSSEDESIVGACLVPQCDEVMFASAAVDQDEAQPPLADTVTSLESDNVLGVAVAQLWAPAANSQEFVHDSRLVDFEDEKRNATQPLYDPRCSASLRDYDPTPESLLPGAVAPEGTDELQHTAPPPSPEDVQIPSLAAIDPLPTEQNLLDNTLQDHARDTAPADIDARPQTADVDLAIATPADDLDPALPVCAVDAAGDGDDDKGERGEETADGGQTLPATETAAVLHVDDADQSDNDQQALSLFETIVLAREPLADPPSESATNADHPDNGVALAAPAQSAGATLSVAVSADTAPASSSSWWSPWSWWSGNNAPAGTASAASDARLKAPGLVLTKADLDSVRLRPVAARGPRPSPMSEPAGVLGQLMFLFGGASSASVDATAGGVDASSRPTVRALVAAMESNASS
jgi:hypothetical protein